MKPIDEDLIKEIESLRSRVSELEGEKERRLQVEEILRHSEERFRTLCENAPVMIDAFDGDGHCLLWNR